MGAVPHGRGTRDESMNFGIAISLVLCPHCQSSGTRHCPFIQRPRPLKRSPSGNADNAPWSPRGLVQEAKGDAKSQGCSSPLAGLSLSGAGAEIHG